MLVRKTVDVSVEITYNDIFNWLTECENVEMLRNLGRYAIKCARDIEEPDDDDFRSRA